MKQELPAMIELADRLLATATPGTLATLFSARGSTYRPLGSMMVSLPGVHAGGISGGCLEEYVARVGERATRDARAVMLDFDTHPDADDHVPTLGCGGSIELLVERLTPHHLRLLERLAGAYERDDYSLLACVVKRSGPSVSVSREWLEQADQSTFPKPELEGVCAKTVRDATSLQMTLEADTDVLIHYVPPLTRLVIFGAGDDARPLCTIGAQLGWHVSVVDRRARLATSARFPDADAVVADDWDEATERLRLTSRTAVVLMTHSLEDDARVLSLLSAQTMAYVGALGPAHRREWLLEEAAARDPLSPEFASTLRGPIGVDLGDRSAAGIAVAVTAEILAQLNGRTAQSLHCKAPNPIAARRHGVCPVAV
jgi:xanthine/CO dehydrogenase XdhC/CoxF family maturation factor